MFNRIVTVFIGLSLAACAAPHPRRADPTPVAPTAISPALQALPSPGDYPIDPANSELRLLVYRAGPLARLGHNHVMVNRALMGSAHIADSIAATSFEVQLPVGSFIVDDAQARTEEGDDFAADVPEDAKQGTRRNMLSAAVLNAAEFPDIRVSSVAFTGSLEAVTAELQVSVAGHSSTVSVPVTLQGEAHHIVAAGSMELRQTALGLAPYSLLGGALQVQDAMQLKFKITVLTN